MDQRIGARRIAGEAVARDPFVGKHEAGFFRSRRAAAREQRFGAPRIHRWIVGRRACQQQHARRSASLRAFGRRIRVRAFAQRDQQILRLAHIARGKAPVLIPPGKRVAGGAVPAIAGREHRTLIAQPRGERAGIRACRATPIERRESACVRRFVTGCAACGEFFLRQIETGQPAVSFAGAFEIGEQRGAIVPPYRAEGAARGGAFETVARRRAELRGDGAGFLARGRAAARAGKRLHQRKAGRGIAARAGGAAQIIGSRTVATRADTVFDQPRMGRAGIICAKRAGACEQFGLFGADLPAIGEPHQIGKVAACLRDPAIACLAPQQFGDRAVLRLPRAVAQRGGKRGAGRQVAPLAQRKIGGVIPLLAGENRSILFGRGIAGIGLRIGARACRALRGERGKRAYRDHRREKPEPCHPQRLPTSAARTKLRPRCRSVNLCAWCLCGGSGRD